MDGRQVFKAARTRSYELGPGNLGLLASQRIPARWWLVLALAPVALCGCRSAATKQEIELLERELRYQEDELYHMEGELSEYESKLLSCRRENAALRHRLGMDFDATRVDGAPIIERSGAPLIQRPGTIIQRQEPGRTSQPRYEIPPPPDVEIPPFQAPIVDPLPSDGRETYVPDQLPPPRARTQGPQGAGLDALDAGALVQRITLNRLLTGAEERDDCYGDDGVMIVIEPRDVEKKIVEAPGEVNVVVFDPQRRGNDALVAQWRFTADEIIAMTKRGPLMQGIELALPWPAQPPHSERLDLVVQFQPPDGRVLEARKQIRVDLVATAPLDWQSPSLARRQPRPATPLPGPMHNSPVQNFFDPQVQNAGWTGTR